jgi:hypothetical protein
MTPEEFELRRDTFDKFIRDIFDYRHLVVVDELKKTAKGGPASRSSPSESLSSDSGTSGKK